MSLQYPHLTTPYRLLSVLVLPEITNKFVSIMREHAIKPIMEKEISIFLGDCLECIFRHPLDPYNRWKFMVSDFCSKYKVDCHGTEELSQIVDDVICTNTMHEVPTAVECRLFGDESVEDDPFITPFVCCKSLGTQYRTLKIKTTSIFVVASMDQRHGFLVDHTVFLVIWMSS